MAKPFASECQSYGGITEGTNAIVVNNSVAAKNLWFQNIPNGALDIKKSQILSSTTDLSLDMYYWQPDDTNNPVTIVDAEKRYGYNSTCVSARRDEFTYFGQIGVLPAARNMLHGITLTALLNSYSTYKNASLPSLINRNGNQITCLPYIQVTYAAITLLELLIVYSCVDLLC